jgi:hypothetical protein
VVWVVGVLLLAWLAWGPAVLLLAAAALGVPRLRWWVQDRLHVSRQVAVRTVGAVAVLAVAVVVVPDGWLPIPPAPGVLAAPSYVGRPATPQAIVPESPTNPQLAAPAAGRAGPLGLQPDVETAWFGLQHCGWIEATSSDVLVALCHDRSGPSLRLVDVDSMRPRATKELPAGDGRSACPGGAAYLDAQDRVVVATTDRSVLAVSTVTAEAGPGLRTDSTWDLKPFVPFGDCLVAVAPDWSGRVWWASRDGLVGTIAPGSGDVRVVDLDEGVQHGFAADPDGGVLLATDEGVHRLTAGPDGAPQVAWTAATEQPSGTAPVLVDGGAVAVTDTTEEQLAVVFLRRGTGEEVCRQPVFEKGKGAVDADLAPVGPGVVVANDHDYTSPRSTLLGFTSTPGIARVDLADGACAERWTSDQVAPGSGVAASWPNGLVYAWTKRPSLLGVSAWYVTGLDAQTGRSMWSVRAGTGLLAGGAGARPAIGPGGSLWMGTLSGLVRVTDRG